MCVPTQEGRRTTSAMLPGSWPSIRGQQDSGRLIIQRQPSKHLTCRGLREDENEMEDRSSRRMRTLVTQMAHRGLSANETRTRADIHDGPEHKGSNRRPDTLMQDRTPPTRSSLLATHGRTIHWVTSGAGDPARRPGYFRLAPKAHVADACLCHRSEEGTQQACLSHVASWRIITVVETRRAIGW